MRYASSLVMNKLFFIQSRDNIYRSTDYYDISISDSSKSITLFAKLSSSETMMFNDFYNTLSHRAITDTMKCTLKEVIDGQSTMDENDIRNNAIIMSGILFGEKTRVYRHGVGSGMFTTH